MRVFRDELGWPEVIFCRDAVRAQIDIQILEFDRPDAADRRLDAVKLDAAASGYCRRILAWPFMREWIAAANAEPGELDELDVEF